MTKLELTRRQFIEIAGAAAATSQLSRGMQASASTGAAGGNDSDTRVIVPVNRDWRFMRQAAPGGAVEAQFVGAEKPGYDDSSWSSVWLPHSWDVGPDNPFTTRGHFRGIGWYRTRIDAPSAWPGRRLL